MPRHELLNLLASLNGLFFFFAMGAVIGSFINVLAYRIPLGKDVVKPASACPHCQTKLAWHDNVPILGWLWLRGRCRYCKSPISAQYPLVELAVALLFALPWVLWFMDTNVTEHIGITREFRAAFAPEWATTFSGRSALRDAWPVFAVIIVMLGCLAAATVVDAKTFTIPLVVCWVMTAAGVVGHTAYALGWGPTAWSPFDAAIPLVDGPWLGCALGGAIGVVFSNLALRFGLFMHSFSDFPAWQEAAERAHREAVERGEASDDPDAGHHGPPVSALLVRTLFFTGPIVAGMFLGFALGQPAGLAKEGIALGSAGGLVIGIALRGLAVRGEAAGDASGAGGAGAAGGAGGAGGADDPASWLAYPHARREMGRELLFLAPVIALMVGGFWLGSAGGPLGSALGAEVNEAGAVVDAPALWVRVLGGALMGYLVGGGVVWGVRIFGTLVFGKEAMGLGDVHLMAGVGACLGWADPTIAFFVAPFFGIAWAIGGVALSRVFKTAGAALPYGPHLAAATVVVLVGKPWVERGLTMMWNAEINLP